MLVLPRVASVGHCLSGQAQRAVDRLGLEATRRHTCAKARSLGGRQLGRVVRAARTAGNGAGPSSSKISGRSSASASDESRISSLAAAIASATRLGLLKERYFVTTSAADGGFLVCVFDPIFVPEGDLRDARVLARLRRDACRMKILAVVLLPPMATWGAESFRGSNSRSAGTPWGTRTIPDDWTEKLNTITKCLLHLARQLTHLKVPWCLNPSRVLVVFLRSGNTEPDCSSRSRGHFP